MPPYKDRQSDELISVPFPAFVSRPQRYRIQRGESPRVTVAVDATFPHKAGVSTDAVTADSNS